MVDNIVYYQSNYRASPVIPQTSEAIREKVISSSIGNMNGVPGTPESPTASDIAQSISEIEQLSASGGTDFSAIDQIPAQKRTFIHSPFAEGK